MNWGNYWCSWETNITRGLIYFSILNIMHIVCIVQAGTGHDIESEGSTDLRVHKTAETSLSIIYRHAEPSVSSI